MYKLFMPLLLGVIFSGYAMGKKEVFYVSRNAEENIVISQCTQSGVTSVVHKRSDGSYYSAITRCVTFDDGLKTFMACSGIDPVIEEKLVRAIAEFELTESKKQ